MIKKWVAMLGIGLAYCFFFIGLMFGAVGKQMAAYTVGVDGIFVVAILTIVPLVIGIHVGVWNQKEEKGTV